MTQNLLRRALSSFIVGLMIGVAFGAESVVLSPKTVMEVLADLSKVEAWKSVNTDHPDYPVIEALKALREEEQAMLKEATDRIERVLQNRRYEAGFVEKNGDRVLVAGTVGDYEVWRSTLYLVAGRAYYAQKKFDLASKYFGAVSTKSVFRSLALLGQAWSQIAILEESPVPGAKEVLLSVAQQLRSVQNELGGMSREEVKIVLAFDSLIQKRYDDASSIAQSAQWKKQWSEEIEAIRIKIIAQSEFQIFLRDSEKSDFNTKTARLRKIHQVVESIDPRFRTAEFSFLASESYWHLASTLRVEDPQKYARESRSALEKADAWIATHVNRALDKSRATLSEEAMFFSVAVLWEQEKYDESIPRLVVIPKLFPQGQFREDVYQLLGDYYYEKGEFDLSIEYYTALADRGTATKAAYGVYKAAWSFYNQEKKWKALRHLERLVSFYRKEFLGKEAPPGSLVKESEQDMLLLLSELLPFKNALDELKLFEYSFDENLVIQEALAATYKKIGKYEDAIGVYQDLLAKAPKSIRAFDWFEALLLTVLSSGNRMALATAIEYYLPKMALVSDSARIERSVALEKQIGNIILTVHREAKKTDDADIWKATDALYGVWRKLLAHAGQGDVWYYAAQRQEQLGKKIQAMELYRMAAEIPGYENANDSALSVLKLIKESLDKLSLKEKPSKEDYEPFGPFAAWYAESYPQTRERNLAEFLLLEIYQKAEKWKDIENFLVGVFGKEGATKEHEDQYLKHNGMLFQSKMWASAYDLARAVMRSGKWDSESGKKFLSRLSRFEQEAAFQNAYTFEKDKKWDEARKWYHLSIATPSPDLEIQTRAWNNLLLTYSLKRQAPEIVTEYEKFLSGTETLIESKKQLAQEEKLLIFSIHMRGAKAYEELIRPMKRLDAMSRALAFAKNRDEEENLRWDMAWVAGVYHLWPKLAEQLGALKESRSKWLSGVSNRVAMGRLIFWNNQVELAWSWVKDLVGQSKDEDPNVLLLIRDIYFRSKKQQLPILVEVENYLISGREKLQKTGILHSLWAELVNPKFDINTIAGWSFSKGRSLAGLMEDTKGSDSPGVQLKKRVDGVGRILNELNRQKDVLGKAIQEGLPQIVVTSVCVVPGVTRGATQLLKSLGSPPVASPQWGEFVKRLNSKIQELQAVEINEKKNCEEQKRANLFLPPVRKLASPLCLNEDCFSERVPSVEEIAKVESQFRLDQGARRVARLEQVMAYMEIGAWAMANATAYGAPTLEEKSLLLAMIRLGVGDAWNAAPLLKESKKNESWVPHARFLEARTIFSHGHRDLASEQLQTVDKKSLYDFEKRLFDQMVTQPKKPQEVDDLDAGFGYSLY